MTDPSDGAGSPRRCSPGERSGGDEERRGVPLVVAPALVRRRDGTALVLHGDAAERVVLALRVARPVVRHEHPGQSGVAVEDQPEHVERLPLVPVQGGVDAHQAGDVRVAVRRRHLDADPAVVGHRGQLVDRVQLAAGVLGVVHAADAGAELEAQRLVVAEHLRDERQVLATDVEGDLAAVDDHALDRRGEVGGLEPLLERARDLVEPAAVGLLGSSREDLRADEPAVAGGVAGAGGAEHAVAYADRADLAGGGGDVLRGLVGGRLVDAAPRAGLRLGRLEVALLGRAGRLVLVALVVAHRSRPFISEVGSARRAAVSSSAISVLRLAPSLVAWTWSWSLRIASMSISGRGGQPGRYMSTGTMWSTPCTIA